MGKADIDIALDEVAYTNKHGNLPTFLPGQRVSGTVHLALQAQKKIESVTISFEGKCYTEITKSSGNNNSSRYSETIELFSLTQELFNGPYTMQPTEVEWPFTFTFPKQSNYIRTRRENSLDSEFVSGPQPLPPSLSVHVAANNDLKAKVQYSLTARLNPESFLRSKQCLLPIGLMRHADFPLPIPEPINMPIGMLSWKSSALRAEKHSFKQKLNHVFTSDPTLKTPSINFDATVYMPQAASVWQPLRTAISIQYQQQAPTDPQNVTLVLDQVVFTLKQYTMVRIRGLDEHGSQVLATSQIDPKMAIPSDNTVLMVTDRLKLVDMTKEIDRLASSFSTYTINHTYKLKFLAVIVHLETGHRFKIKTKTDFTILPAEQGRPSHTTQSAFQTSPAYVDHSILPAYEGSFEQSAQQRLLPDNHLDPKQDWKGAEEKPPSMRT